MDGMRGQRLLRRTRMGVLLFLVGLLSACQGGLPPLVVTPPGPSPSRALFPLTPQPSPVSPPAEPTATTKEIGGVSPGPYSHYELAAELDYATHLLTVTQQITYVNRLSVSLSELLLVVEPNRQPGVFFLDGLTWGDGRPVADYTLDRAVLRLPLPRALLPGASRQVKMSYRLALPARPGPLGYTSRQTNLGDWYPFVPPYRVERGWLVHEPAAAGEHLVYDVADYGVRLRLVRPPQALTIAAGPPAVPDGEWVRYRLDAARTFAWSVSPDYVALRRSAGPVEVTAFVFAEHVVAGEASLQAASEALTLYAGLFGPYPHDGLAVVEADFPDGMEYDGLFFLGAEYLRSYDGTARGYLVALSAHETAHQWWYGLVGNDQALEPWLDEALCTYSEALFYRALYPDEVDWWWDYRVTRFEPAGWVNSTIYDHGAFRSYVNAVYLRGALFLEALRNLVGDEVFLSFLRDYAVQKGHGQATAGDFWTVLSQHTTVDLGPLIREYFSLRRWQPR